MREDEDEDTRARCGALGPAWHAEQTRAVL